MLLSPRENGLDSLFQEVWVFKVVAHYTAIGDTQRHPRIFGDGPNTVSGSTVSNTELSQLCALNEFLRVPFGLSCAKAISPSPSQNSPSMRRTQ